MITTIVINGITKIVLIPESDIEKITLREFKANDAKLKIETPVDGITILGKSIPDAIIISADTKKEQSK